MNRFVLTGALLLPLMLVACGQAQDAQAPADAHKHAHASAMAEPAAAPSAQAAGLSLFQLQSSWTNQAGESVHWTDFSGQIVVMAMVYTHCDHTCPRIIADIRRIRSALLDDGKAPEDVVFMLASFDPQRDTVQHLQRYGQETGVTEQGWQLLRAPEHTARELAAVLGVRYRQTEPGEFSHSNIITVLDPQGQLYYQQKGLGSAPDGAVQAVKTLLSQR